MVKIKTMDNKIYLAKKIVLGITKIYFINYIGAIEELPIAEVLSVEPEGTK